ncbi:ribbon-helix-helix domain-containing protein [Patescibacteria group bacterium]|nr:ribbon-helix-helix domain-containing protein [Patescibacteria group bacterium]MBU2633024.1 ribbon-helix-helix domain-containing protein [Patescibacteria group bacterium]
MRSIINISLPKSMAKAVEKEVKTGNFASKSEFFRSLVRNWEENRLLKELKESQREIADGKGKVLRSLKDLI